MTTSDDTPARHLSFANLDLLWAAGNAVEFPLPGDPQCTLRIDPGERTLRLATSYQRPEPDLRRLAGVGLDALMRNGEEIAELVVDVGDDTVRTAYAFLSDVADRLQLEGQTLAAATRTALDRYAHLLTMRSSLSREQEVGLFGELLVLRHLLKVLEPELAVASWHGPTGGEHDFTLPDIDVETKTTTSEARVHMIHGLTQLAPSPGRPLRLLSIQVTPSAADEAQTLPELVATVRSATGPAVDDFEARLGATGWMDGDNDLYETSWALRSVPRAYEVDASFPAMTPDRISPVIPHFDVVREVAYRIDVSALHASAIPGGLSSFTENLEP